MENLVVLTGPTAIGKSSIGVEVAGRINGEIISADSMQVYWGMNIGTAKINPTEMYTCDGIFINHHLMSFLRPDQRFSVADYKCEVNELIPAIAARGKMPILLGGTGLYIEAVIDPYEFVPVPIDEVLRSELQKTAEDQGNDYLHRQLVQIDPVAGERIHPNDIKRVIRAMEVFYQTGNSITSMGRRAPGVRQSNYNLCYIGLEASREFIYRRINQRADEMIANGLVEEVQSLLEQGFSPDLPPLQGLGYRQILGYLQGHYDLTEAIRLLKRDTRHYAKRQMTWFRRDSRIQWYNVERYLHKEELAAEIALTIRRSMG